jgi:enoyl-CoA hydratase/carnithine racemase
MLHLKSVSVLLKDRMAIATIGWLGGVGSWELEISEQIDELVDWVEDAAPCDVLVFRTEGATAKAQVPTIDQCRRWEKLVLRLDRLECLTVAAIHGPCTRAWMQLALACDLRAATRPSSLKIVELKEGYLPGMNMFRLAKYLGLGTARRLLFTGAEVTASQAASLGLVDELCEDLDTGLARLLQAVEPARPLPLRIARRLLNESFATAFEDFMGQYLASQNRCLSDLKREPS